MTTSPTFDPALAVGLVDANPDNPRKDLGDLTELADSIREQGIVEPVVVEPVDETASRFVLLAGHRRLAAALQAGLTSVPALVHDQPSPRHERVERMLTENLQRADLTLVEEGDAYQMLLDMPDAELTPAKLAKRLGKSVRHVTATVKAAGLPESTRERLIRGQINLEDAARIERFAKDPEALQRINKAAEAGPVALDRAIAEAKSEADRVKARAARKRELRKAGRTLVDISSDEWDDATFLPGIYRGLEIDTPSVAAAGSWSEREQAKRDALEEKHFAEHPDAHLVAVSDGYVGLEVYAKCADAAWHDGVAGETSEQRAEREAAEAAQAEQARLEGERRVKLEAAAVARRQFLGRVAASDAADKLAHEIALDAFKPLLTTGDDPAKARDLRSFAQIVLPNLPDATLDNPKDVRKRVRTYLERASVAELVVLNDVRLNLGRDYSLTSTSSGYWRDDFFPDLTRWRRRLSDFYGYEPAPIETEMHELNNPTEDGEPS